jgi:hypothetical protein
MFDSQTIIATGTGATTTLYSPWFPRGGDHAIFGLEVQAWSQSDPDTKLKIEVYHKKREESGDGALAGSASDKIEIASNASEPWRSTRDWGSVGFYDLVRFKITFTADSSTQWAIFRILAPIWYDSVKA